MKNKTVITLLSLLLLSLMMIHCNDTNDIPEKQTQQQTTMKEASSTDDKTNDFIVDAWIRPAATGMSTAAYMKIKNNTDFPDTLYKAECSFAELTQIHETVKADEVMKMQEVNNIIIKPNETFELKPGGHHIMLINTTEDVVKDTERNITLYFSKKGAVEITAPVIDKGNSMMEHDKHQ